MNILICIKQVPNSQKIKIDSITGNLDRGSSSTKLNPFDLIALEAGLQMKDEFNASITVLTMGPIQAKEVLYEALAMGADEAYIASDRAFAGGDVLATSMTLASVIKSIKKEFDIIICGQQTTDGDTAQVGPSLAAMLKIPHVSFVTHIKNKETLVEFETNDQETIIYGSVMKPCLLTIDKNFSIARLPSYLKYKKYLNTEISVISLNDILATSPIDSVGASGSATRVLRIYPPETKNEMKYLNSEDIHIGDKICDFLLEKHILEGDSHEGN